MKKYSLLFVISLFFVVASFAQNKDVNAIRALLNSQTVEWNKGDIDAFMKGYWNSDSLLFVGQSGPRYGYKNTLESYKKGYPDADHMGKLSFDILNIKLLSGDHAFVLGKWMLKRNAGDVSGYYTLVLKKMKGKWLIISDHSS